jgi:isoquinoline 1-oxidoreductase/isoquinoline 1-oxidoreductase alpha subunit
MHIHLFRAHVQDDQAKEADYSAWPMADAVSKLVQLCVRPHEPDVATLTTQNRSNNMVQIVVNGQRHQFDGDPEMPLLWYLRDELGLTGTKFGCGMALCGACTVHLDGQPTRACVTPVGSLQGRSVTTIEAIHEQKVGAAVQAAWIEAQAPQCGYCQSGQVMSAVALLTTKPSPTDADINDAMSGNICRCATYQRIRAAIHHASEELKHA